MDAKAQAHSFSAVVGSEAAALDAAEVDFEIELSMLPPNCCARNLASFASVAACPAAAASSCTKQ